MFDVGMRKLIDPPLDRLGRWVAALGVSANTVTLVGFAIGLVAVPLLAIEAYGVALVAIAVNRVFDGLDGAVARHQRPTDFGGYLDIVCDFIFYAAVPVGFALARPEANGVAAAVLILSFVGTGSSFLAYAIIAAKRGVSTTARGSKSFFHIGGLTEGTETIAFFVVMCLLPGLFVVLAFTFSTLAWLTTIGRIHSTWRAFGED